MSLRLEVKKLMLERSPRVKAIDFHPTNPWVLYGLYSGTLALYDYSNNTCIRTLQASTFPIRAIKFIPQKNWIVCGSDDFQLRVFNYNTMQKVKTIEAHNDFIRAIIVHPNQPYVITASDDAKIKIWNHDKDFTLVRTLDQHKHFVMALAFNPKDLTKFGSTSMDKTIKIWNLTTEGKANFTLQGHKGSVNCIDFYKGDKPHLITGSDDHTIKIWDYQTRQCLHTIQNYKLSVTSVCFHPQLPLIISTAEDGQSMIFHSSSYNIMNTLQYNLGMGWSCGVGIENSNVIGLGFDEGSVVVKIGSDEPVVDIHNGKILYAKNMEIFNMNLKAISYDQDTTTPPSPTVNRLFISPKELGSTDIYPTALSYSPNGHHFGVSNTKQFAVIKLASFKTLVLGNGSHLTWFGDGEFVVVQNDTIHEYRNLEYSGSVKIPIVVEKMFGGKLLTVVGKETTLIYDWNNLSKPLHKLQQATQRALWSGSGSQLILITSDKSTLFSYNPKNHSLTESLTISDRLTSCCFIEQILYYMTRSGKIYIAFHGHEFFYSMVDDKRQFILGNVKQQSRLYLMDRSINFHQMYVPFSVIEEVADFVIGKRRQEPQVPQQFRNLVAKCYHAFGLVKQAYKLTLSTEHKFQLALALGYTRDAYKLAISNNMSQKIKVIGDLSLKKGEIELAIDCYQRIDDLSTLLMIYSSLQLKEKLLKLGQKSQRMTRMNIAYMCYYLTGEKEKCIDVLIKSKRFSQAALFARTYCVERVSECVKLWKQSLTDKSIADKISDLDLEGGEQEEEGDEQANDQQEAGQEEEETLV